MPTTRMSPHATDVARKASRDEIVTIVAAALTRLIQTDRTPAIRRPDTPTSMTTANLSESAEIGLELSGETRLSVPAG